MNYKKITPLLHNARLTELSHKDGTVSLTLECLRRNPDGSELDDESLELRLFKVENVIAYYDPFRFHIRPSTLQPDETISPTELEQCSFNKQPVTVSIDSEEARFDMLSSSRSIVLVGDLPDESLSRDHYLCLTFLPVETVEESCTTSFYFSFKELQMLAAGSTLNYELWSEQFVAWKEYWDRQWAGETETTNREQQSGVHHVKSNEESPKIPDYDPPAQPPFRLNDQNAPDWLIEPIKNFHTGILHRDWNLVSSSLPAFDRESDKHISEIERRILGNDYGCWIFIRQIDEWWEEDRRAYVVARGIEHCMPDEFGPATNMETVIYYLLKKHGDNWLIHDYSQGWPADGSAPVCDREMPWLDEWKINV